MPLLITPPQPFVTVQTLPAAQVYAIILKTNYDTRARLIEFEVGYYTSEQAYVDECHPLQINGLPLKFQQAATAQEANAVPIFDFLESVLTQQLQAALQPGTAVANVA